MTDNEIKELSYEINRDELHKLLKVKGYLKIKGVNDVK